MPETMVGDMWIQFGWLGIIGASLLVGAFYRSAYTWVARRRNAGWTIALCYVVSTYLFSAGLDIASLLTAATREFLVVGVVAAWVLHPATSDDERRLA
jgi:putative Mn2+ efflux pump MntP